jgi:hypothetical protein
VKRAAPHWARSRPLLPYSTGTPSGARALYATTRVRHTTLFLTGPLTPPSPFEGYVRVASVAASFASAFDSPQRALLLYLLAFTCDELVRVLSHVVGVRVCAELWTCWLLCGQLERVLCSPHCLQDGRFARKFNQCTVFGAVLDMVTDRCVRLRLRRH